MADQQTMKRRSPRQLIIKIADGGTGDAAHSVVRDTVDCAMHSRRRKTSAVKSRSASSPPARGGHDRDSESQSGSDDDPIFKTPEVVTNIKFTNSSPATGDKVSPKIKTSKKPIKVDTERSFKRSAAIREELPNSIFTIVGIFFTICSIGFLIFICFTFGNETKASVVRSLGTIDDDINRDLDKLRGETKQGKTFWRSVYSGLAGLTEESPRLPAVFLMVVPQDSQQSAVCLAHHLADIVTKAFGDSKHSVSHDTRDHLDKVWDDHKLFLDEQLQRVALTHSAVIYNLELMPAKTATLLHGYCDNDNAPHKRAVFLLLLELPVHYDSISAAHLDLTVERRLHELWSSDLPEDHIPGLMSRVASQALLVKPETQGVLKSLCHL